jgi:ATP-binding cassette subfamily B protein
MDANLILVFDKGRIIQKGTHQELMKTSGMYRNIFDIQTIIDVELEKEIASVDV